MFCNCGVRKSFPISLRLTLVSVAVKVVTEEAKNVDLRSSAKQTALMIVSRAGDNAEHVKTLLNAKVSAAAIKGLMNLA